jgi:hypothetical protein
MNTRESYIQKLHYSKLRWKKKRRILSDKQSTALNSPTQTAANQNTIGYFQAKAIPSQTAQDIKGTE